MKPIKLAALALSFITLNAIFTTAHAQGSLTPNGAPGPMLKTLGQIEPRTDIETVAGDGSNLHVITNSGSYYLSTNINVVISGRSAISIVANNVTLDLNGFTINGNGIGYDGIRADNFHTNCVIRNGIVVGWTAYGIYLGNCYSGVMEKLITQQNNYAGIQAGRQMLIQDCLSCSNVLNGIQAKSECVVRGCISEYNGQHGIYISESGCRVDNNTFTSNQGYGLYVPNGSSLITRNSAFYNHTNYNILTSNTYGPITPSGGGVATNHPWANFQL